MSRLYCWLHAAAVCVALLAIRPCHATDAQDIERVIREYAADQESGDSVAQGRLMTEDRVGVWDDTVHLDPTAAEMARQQKAFRAYSARYPGLKYRVTIRDINIRVWDRTAVATFFMDMTAVVPSSLPAADAARLAKPIPAKLHCHTFIERHGRWLIAASAVTRIQEK